MRSYTALDYLMFADAFDMLDVYQPHVIEWIRCHVCNTMWMIPQMPHPFDISLARTLFLHSMEAREGACRWSR